MFGLAALKSPVLLAAGVIVTVGSLAGYIAILRAENAALVAQKETLTAQAIAFDMACRANTERLEDAIAAQNDALAARETEMQSMRDRLALADAASRAATQEHERAVADIMGSRPDIAQDLVGVEKDLAVCRAAIRSLRRVEDD